MDPIKNSYRNWIQAEVESPEAIQAREAFFRKRFEPIAAGSPRKSFLFSPSFRLAFVGCIGLFILVRIGLFNPSDPAFDSVTSMKLSKSAVMADKSVVASPVSEGEPRQIEIKKLSSQMGPTVAYQKNFSDVQITVVWVFPQGV